MPSSDRARRALARLAAACALTLGPAAAGLGKDMAELYRDSDLQRWQGKLQPLVSEIRNAAASALVAEGGRRAREAKLELPLRSLLGDPFDFRSCFERKTITVPVLSVKLLHDLVFSDLWLAHNGYERKAFRYVDVLKRRSAAEFAGGRYPTPAEALGVPADLLEDPPRDGPLGVEFAKEFQGELLFLVSHEVAHIVLQHPCRGSTDEEVEADLLGYQMTVRNNGNPAGLVNYFTLFSFWGPRRGDFAGDAAYRQWVKSSGYPMTSERVRAVGALLYGKPEEHLGGAADSKLLMAATRSMGYELGVLAQRMDRLESVDGQINATLAQDLASLRPEKSRAAESSSGLFELVAMSEFWWRVPEEQFPIVAGLKPGEYSREASARAGRRLIRVEQGSAAQALKDGVLGSLVFEFAGVDGLREISGSFARPSAQPEAVRAVTRRFGAPSRIEGGTHYWMFDKSVLAIAPASLRLAPR